MLPSLFAIFFANTAMFSRLGRTTPLPARADFAPCATLPRMTQRLSPGTIALLVVPPFMWAANAVVGRMVHELISPMTLNFLRWALALLLLLPLI